MYQSMIQVVANLNGSTGFLLFSFHENLRRLRVNELVWPYEELRVFLLFIFGVVV